MPQANSSYACLIHFNDNLKSSASAALKYTITTNTKDKICIGMTALK